MTQITQTIRIGHVERIITGAKTIVNRNGQTFVDGKLIEELDVKKFPDKEINIYITGDIEKLEVDYCNKVQVDGSVKKLQTASGDVDVKGNVTGGIQTASGDIEVSGNVDGDVKTASGDVDCGNVSGSVSTVSGDISHM